MEATSQHSFFSTGSTKSNLAIVFLLICCGLFFNVITTASFSILKSHFPVLAEEFFAVSVLVSLCVVAISVLFNKLAYKEGVVKTKLTFYFLNSIIASFLFLNTTPLVLQKSAVYTTLVVALIFLISLKSTERISEELINPLLAVNFLLVIASTYLLFFMSLKDMSTTILDDFSLYGGLIVYSGLLLCNFFRMLQNINHRQFDILCAAVYLHVNILNLYARIVAFKSRESFLSSNRNCFEELLMSSTAGLVISANSYLLDIV